MKKCTSKPVVFFLLILATWCLTTSVHAEPEQIKDPYHPTVNDSPITLMKDNMITQALGGRLVDLDVWVGEFFKFDDNIFNTSEDKEADTIFSTAAGFKMEAIQKNVWSVRLEGQLQHNAYGKNSEYNGFEGYFHGRGSVDFSPALSARVFANYDSTYDTVRDEQDIFVLHRYSAGGGISLRPSPFAGVDIDYAYTGQRREVSRMDYQNYDENSISVRPYYDITPNTSIYLQLGVAQADPTQDWYNTSQMLSAVLGAAWHYKDTANLFAEAGYRYMHFNGNGDVSDDIDSVDRPILRAGGGLALTSDWQTGAEVSYMPVYSAVSTSARNSNYIDRTQASAFLSYSPGAGRFTAKLSPFYRINEPSNDVSYREYGALLGVSYSFTDWLNVSAGYRYSVTDYDDDAPYDRNSVTFGVAATF